MTIRLPAQLAEDAAAARKRAAQFLTTDELAELCRTSPESVRFWRHVGKGPKSFKVGRRVLYAIEDVETWLADARDGAA